MLVKTISYNYIIFDAHPREILSNLSTKFIVPTSKWGGSSFIVFKESNCEYDQVYFTVTWQNPPESSSKEYHRILDLHSFVLYIHTYVLLIFGLKLWLR